MTLQKWGGLACIVLIAASIISGGIYLTGKLDSPSGPFTYSLADFLAGPLWAASLVTVVFALRERLQESAPRRMNLALLAAVAAALAMVLVATIRSANRMYHLSHPELHLENNSDVLVVWTTLVTGITGAGTHFLGWTLLLSGSAGWTSGRLPRALCALLGGTGIVSLLVYAFPNLEGIAVLLGLILGAWLGVGLWMGEKAQKPALEATE